MIHNSHGLGNFLLVSNILNVEVKQTSVFVRYEANVQSVNLLFEPLNVCCPVSSIPAPPNRSNGWKISFFHKNISISSFTSLVNCSLTTCQ